MRIEGVPFVTAPPRVRAQYETMVARLGRVPSPATAMAHHPDLLETFGALTQALAGSRLVEPRLKSLACIRAAQMTGCPFWVDINSAGGRSQGLTDEQLADIAHFEGSSRFDPKEKAVLRYTEAMTRTPAEVSQDLFDELKRYFDTAQLVELTGMIALENFRARFNRGFDVGSDGFCELPPDHPVRAELRSRPPA